MLRGGDGRVDEADFVVVLGFAAGGPGGLLGDAGRFATFGAGGLGVGVGVGVGVGSGGGGGGGGDGCEI